MKSITPALNILLAIVVISGSIACSKTAGNGGSSAPGAGSASNPNNMDGTYAGGGGNGINGKAIESYHQDISTLPEFQMYIAPVLKRMAQSSPDVFVGYLNWAIHHKTWYLVPVSLPNLPKDKTALAFPSDQLALHSESEIYIDQIAYDQKPRREKAFLLMHELVMGARLLMKHSAKYQCSALNTDQQTSSCDSEALLKLAVNPPGSDGDKPSLTGSDDEAVRSMTAYLMTHNQDYTGVAIRSFRLGLGFNYPWDRLVSNFTLDNLDDAFTRANATGDKLFHVNDSTIGRKTDDLNSSNTSGGQGVPPTPAPIPDECQLQNHFRSGKSFWFDIQLYITSDRHGFNFGIQTEDRFVHPDGVLDPRGGTQVVDHLQIAPDPNSAGRYSEQKLFLMDAYVTREAHPRLIRIEAREVVVIPNSNSQKGEIVPKRNTPPVICAVAN